MRVQISLPEAAWDSIRTIAAQERRYPKQQVEYMLLKALGMLPIKGVDMIRRYSWVLVAETNEQHDPVVLAGMPVWAVQQVKIAIQGTRVLEVQHVSLCSGLTLADAQAELNAVTLDLLGEQSEVAA